MLDIIINPFITVLLVLYGLLGGNVFLAIVAFTILVRFALLPLTMKQQRSFKRMQELSPKLKQLQEKYKNDRERLTQEQMALYREHGVNPFAGCLPLLVQLPIFLSLWRAILATLASTPDQLLELQHRIMIGGLDHLVPLKNTFLWMNLALPDPFYILPILVVITTYLQQKLIMPVSSTSSSSGNDAADQAARMSKQMTTFMPLMFGFFALTYSSGLSIYFITSNIVGIIQYAMMGKADFRRLIGKESTKKEEKVIAEMPADEISDAVIEAPAAKPKPSTKTAAPVREPRTPKEPIEPGSVISATGRPLKPGISERKLTGSAAAASNVASSNGKSTKTPAKSSSRNRPKK
ncbi:MAG: membrane protein insertase YidC [Chloroflexi bacterium]|nr:membrane protein insertase YidC [Chloroflexota bacterium]